MKDIDLKSEQRKVALGGLWSALFCAAILAVSYLYVPSWFRLPASAIDELVFALQADVFVLLVLAIAVRMVSRIRFSSQQDISGSAYGAPSERITVASAFLQNTLEQAVLAMGAHLIFATIADGAALALIPAAVLLFIIGRITFYIGYPNGAGARAFGMVTTALPSVLALIWSASVVVTGIWQEFAR